MTDQAKCGLQDPKNASKFCALAAGHTGKHYAGGFWWVAAAPKTKAAPAPKASKKKPDAPPPAPAKNEQLAKVGYCGARFESFARADDTCVLGAGHAGPHENTSTGTREVDVDPRPLPNDFPDEPEDGDDPLEDEVRSDADRELAKQQREAREAHERELSLTDTCPKCGRELGEHDGKKCPRLDVVSQVVEPVIKAMSPKKVSKIYTAAEREAITKKEVEYSRAKETKPTAMPDSSAARVSATTPEIFPTLKVHPAADALPLIEGAEFDALVDDIRTNGLRHKPVLDHAGEWLVDGRNRKRACEQLGIAIEYDHLPEGTNIAAFVISTNLQRRHLTPSQRAMIAAEIANLTQGHQKTRPGGGFEQGVTQAEAANGALVGERTVQRANAVHDKGVPELVAAVKSGKVDLKGAEQVAKLSPKKQREIVKKHIDTAKSPVRAGKLAAHAKQEEKREVVKKINEQRVAPAAMGPFGVIVIDPPWPYDNSDQHEGSRGHIDYPPMSIQALCELAPDLDARAKDNCILGLWVTNAFIHEVGRLLFAWGFDHRTMITWDKELAGVGTLPRGQTEHLIIATRGAPVHTLNEITTMLRVKRREHSRKPDEMYELLAKHCSGPMIDMFSREQRSGWSVWGAETSKFATEAA